MRSLGSNPRQDSWDDHEPPSDCENDEVKTQVSEIALGSQMKAQMSQQLNQNVQINDVPSRQQL